MDDATLDASLPTGSAAAAARSILAGALLELKAAGSSPATFAAVRLTGVDEDGKISTVPAQPSGAAPAKAWADAHLLRYVPAVLSEEAGVPARAGPPVSINGTEAEVFVATRDGFLTVRFAGVGATVDLALDANVAAGLGREWLGEGRSFAGATI